jgi:hypothetical protein
MIEGILYASAGYLRFRRAEGRGLGEGRPRWTGLRSQSSVSP